MESNIYNFTKKEKEDNSKILDIFIPNKFRFGFRHDLLPENLIGRVFPRGGRSGYHYEFNKHLISSKEMLDITQNLFLQSPAGLTHSLRFPLENPMQYFFSERLMVGNKQSDFYSVNSSWVSLVQKLDSVGCRFFDENYSKVNPNNSQPHQRLNVIGLERLQEDEFNRIKKLLEPGLIDINKFSKKQKIQEHSNLPLKPTYSVKQVC